jgi:hypothetical protein
MIRYALRCKNEHEFDAWFRSGDAYDEQRAKMGVECPDCGSHEVEKALMAPSLAKGALTKTATPPPEAMRKMHVMMSALRKHVEENSDYVGDKFAEEARRIHYGETEKHDIYGEATLDEARELLEEGVEVAPLPGLTTPKTN